TEDDPTVSTQDDPALDTGVSQQEWYDEGRTNAAGKKDMDETDSPVGGRKIA
ncbi:hypothetical protein HY380_01805, partial [Candidatus Saccharibacteria bacterium]|nr:hypothetical protein [Candidatus Saccharibacteria bacterium]